jgi:hypothetical protein
MSAAKIAADAEFKREQLKLEFDLKVAQMNAEFALKREQMAAELALRHEQMALDAQSLPPRKRGSQHNVDLAKVEASGIDGVRMGGEVG